MGLRQPGDALLALSALFAVGAFAMTSPAAAAPAPTTLALHDAVTRALARSPEVQLARVAVEEADLAVMEAEVGEVEGKSRQALRRAMQDRELARSAFLSAVHEVAVTVEEAYYEVLRRRQLLAVREQIHGQARRQDELATARFAAGRISRQELREASDAAQNGREGVEQATRGVVAAEATLRAAVGLPRGAPLILEDNVPLQWIEPELDAAIARALANRREVREAEVAAAFARQEAQNADNPYTPPVELQRAKLSLRRAELQWQQTRERVAAEVRTLWLQLAEAWQKVEATRRAQDLAASRLVIARARHEAGQLAMLELLKAQADAASAQLDAVAATWDYNLQKARWLRAVTEAPLPELPPDLARWVAGWPHRNAELAP